MKHNGWIFVSGSIWFAVGFMLMYKGLGLIAQGQLDPSSLTALWKDSFSNIGNLLIFLALVIGFAKGRFVFTKTVKRVVGRIRSLPVPIRFSQVYTPSYWILIVGMMLLGMVFRFLPIPVDLRGVIDLAVGSALVNGAMLYFREARIKPSHR